MGSNVPCSSLILQGISMERRFSIHVFCAVIPSQVHDPWKILSFRLPRNYIYTLLFVDLYLCRCNFSSCSKNSKKLLTEMEQMPVAWRWSLPQIMLHCMKPEKLQWHTHTSVKRMEKYIFTTEKLNPHFCFRNRRIIWCLNQILDCFSIEAKRLSFLLSSLISRLDLILMLSRIQLF